MAQVNWAKLVGEIVGHVAQNGEQISQVSRMSQRSQATFALTLGLVAAFASMIGHLHDPADTTGAGTP